MKWKAKCDQEKVDLINTGGIAHKNEVDALKKELEELLKKYNEETVLEQKNAEKEIENLNNKINNMKTGNESKINSLNVVIKELKAVNKVHEESQLEQELVNKIEELEVEKMDLVTKCDSDKVSEKEVTDLEYMVLNTEKQDMEKKLTG